MAYYTVSELKEKRKNCNLNFKPACLTEKIFLCVFSFYAK